ncbi:MAG: sterol desaturase family protein [Pseudomonadota bacterium]
MDDLQQLIELEPAIRLGGFLLLIAVLGYLQWLRPLRGDPNRLRRTTVNLSLSIINTLILRLAFPLLAVAWAVDVYQREAGLLGALQWPVWLTIPLAVVIFDLAIYWQHRLMHFVPLLWRLHRIHHTDREFDLTTGVRFHPIEIMLSMSLKLGLIALLGPHPIAVLMFELLLSLFALWTHSNLALPQTIDRPMRWLLVTPSMHRIHHSTWQPETDANYGFHLSCWDRLFGSYRAKPRQDERNMPIGLDEFMQDRDQRLSALLINPFRRR